MTHLYVETRGQGPDLVLLHGWGLNLRAWDGLASVLEKSFRLITVDLPGHGRSEWNPKARTPAEQAWQIHATLSSLSDRYSLLGWSLGGQIALDLAAAMPGSVERLILVATTPRFATGPDWPYGMPASVLEKMAHQLRTNYKRTVTDFLELQVRGSVASEKVLADLQASLFAHGEAHPKALVSGLETLESSDLRPMLHLVRAPALVTAGQYDRVTLPAASRALAESLPAARYIEIRRAAHAPFLSHTVEFATLVTDFLRDDADTSAAGEGASARRADTSPGQAGASAADTDTPSARETTSAETNTRHAGTGRVAREVATAPSNADVAPPVAGADHRGTAPPARSKRLDNPS
jgi:pimeloyl-[acyl-carrier protein] methyl ester esterase